MTSKSVSLSVLTLTFLVAAYVGKVHSSQNHERVSVLDSPVDEKTVVRFFYQPSGDYFHFPLVFRVVEENDPLFNTTPMREEGRTAYISLPEMQDIAHFLAHSGLTWQDSEKVEVLGSCKKLGLTGIGLDSMDVRFVSSTGTARAQISPKAICTILRPLDAAFKTPRALWEFQRFRLNYNCKVPKFKPGAYPDHE